MGASEDLAEAANSARLRNLRRPLFLTPQRRHVGKIIYELVTLGLVAKRKGVQVADRCGHVH